MARRRSSKPPEEDFPMTPMIDMVFLLLVFFMTVSTIAKVDQLVELDLAESSESDVPEDTSNRRTISLDAEGLIHFASSKVSLEEMKSEVGEELKVNPDLQIHLRADADTPYSKVKEVLKSCAEVGAYEVIYATYQLR
ncbi:MAG: biopolymer transporter ExbD [Verrucomicrobiota bacterium]